MNCAQTSCSRKGIYPCKCGLKSYCSDLCYRKNWKEHRLECKLKFAGNATETRPFDADQLDTPEFIQITSSNYSEALSLCVSPEQETYVGTIAESLVECLFKRWKPRLTVENGVFVGFFAYSNTQDELRLHRLFVDCNFQGRGIGSKILNYIESVIAKTTAAKKITLSVHVEAKEAIGLYKKFGFTLKKTESDHFDGEKIL